MTAHGDLIAYLDALARLVARIRATSQTVQVTRGEFGVSGAVLHIAGDDVPAVAAALDWGKTQSVRVGMWQGRDVEWAADVDGTTVRVTAYVKDEAVAS